MGKSAEPSGPLGLPLKAPWARPSRKAREGIDGTPKDHCNASRGYPCWCPGPPQPRPVKPGERRCRRGLSVGCCANLHGSEAGTRWFGDGIADETPPDGRPAMDERHRRASRCETYASCLFRPDSRTVSPSLSSRPAPRRRILPFCCLCGFSQT